jgi:hypothetical protein
VTGFESTVDCLVVWRARAGVGLGFTAEAAAVRLAADIAEFRNDGGIPTHVRTVITVLPQQRVLEIRVEGLSVETDPDRTTIREVTNTLFELAANTISSRSTPPRRRCSPNASCSWTVTADRSPL